MPEPVCPRTLRGAFRTIFHDFRMISTIFNDFRIISTIFYDFPRFSYDFYDFRMIFYVVVRGGSGAVRGGSGGVLSEAFFIKMYEFVKHRMISYDFYDFPRFLCEFYDFQSSSYDF